MVVEYLITIKTLTTKKLRRNRQKFEIFFVKFLFFSEDYFDIQLNISCIALYTFNSLTLVTANDIYYNNQSPH